MHRPCSWAKSPTRAQLIAGGTYQETVTDALPAVLPGQYFVIVQADGAALVPDNNRGNNTRASTAAIAVTVPASALGTPAAGTIGSGQDMYYSSTCHRAAM